MFDDFMDLFNLSEGVFGLLAGDDDDDDITPDVAMPEMEEDASGFNIPDTYDDDFEDDAYVVVTDEDMDFADEGGSGYEDAAEPYEVDVDGDGIIDGFQSEQYLDTDGDGYIDTVLTQLEVDTDGDGYTDTVITVTGIDADEDGTFESETVLTQTDLDGDGFTDTLESVTNEDTDGDGIIDTVTEYGDLDGDGYIDFTTITMGQDTDGDGIIDHMQVAEDYDGDGELDAFSEFVDYDGDGAWDPADGSAMDGCAPAYDTYDPSQSDPDSVVGDPEDAMDSWHWQETNSSCAVASQEFVLEELTGQEFDESDLRDLAEENGWYDPDGGTTLGDVGNILEYMGLKVDRSFENDIDDIEQCLADGGEVIVAVDSSEMWDGESDDYFGPGDGADHAIQVIGIDRTDPGNPMVIINDSGVANGAGAMVPLDVFMDAWEDSDCFMVEAYA